MMATAAIYIKHIRTAAYQIDIATAALSMAMWVDIEDG
jgi:hypothetical protein